jgi:hypothetical protein
LLQVATTFATRNFLERDQQKLTEVAFIEIVRFYAFVIKLAIALAFIGQLKSCTLELFGLAAEKSGGGMISFTKFTRALTNWREPKAMNINHSTKDQSERVLAGMRNAKAKGVKIGRVRKRNECF